MKLLDDGDTSMLERRWSPQVPAVRSGDGVADKPEQLSAHEPLAQASHCPEANAFESQRRRAFSQLWTAIDSRVAADGVARGNRSALQTRRVAAEVLTGVNRFLGAPRWDVQPLLGTSGFTLVGAHNPQGGSALPLTPESSHDTVLATTLDPTWLDRLGLDVDDIDPLLVNVPLHRVPVISDATSTRSRLPALLEARNGELALAEPAGPITLGRWLRARGKLLFIDSPSVYPEIAVELRDLLPHALYTLWSICAVDGSVRAVPLGGVPNVVVTDRDGNASFHRTLCSSPLVPRASDAKLLFIDVVYHSDHACYGAVPEIGRDGFPAGIVAQTHLGFLISGTHLEAIARATVP
jgi:hypothetical protein